MRDLVFKLVLDLGVRYSHAYQEYCRHKYYDYRVVHQDHVTKWVSELTDEHLLQLLEELIRSDCHR